MKTRNIFRPCKQANSGSAIITVVISMFLIIALASALLYTAYVGYSVSITERGEGSNFYSADSEMSLVISGVQKQVSDALVVAYTETLTKYAKGEDIDPQKDLSDNLIKKLGDNTVCPTPVISGSGDTYSVSALANFLAYDSLGVNNGSITLNIKNNTVTLSGTGTIEKAIDAKGLGYILLKGVSLQFKSENGYETKISTDIKISIPEFFAAGAVTSDSGNYAVIAEKGLIVPVNLNDITISSGNVYAEGEVKSNNGIIEQDPGIDLSSGKALTIQDGNVCAKDGIRVYNGSTLNFSFNKELWTDEIRLGQKGKAGGSINLDGKIYVANDLVFETSPSAANLKGEYLGFGSPDDEEGGSAILVNAQGSTLDIQNLSRLMLAGVSYIDTSTINGTSPIMMGESIAAKPDQLAYLLPTECMENYYSNPCILDEAKTPPKPIGKAVLWRINGVDKTLDYYLNLGENDKKGTVQTIYPQNQGIAYIFIVFKDRSAANEYFKDYFTAYPQRIQQYSSLYLSMKNNAADVDAAGNTFYSQDEKTLSLSLADTDVFTGNISSRYENKKSPLDKFVYKNELDNLTNQLVFSDSADKDVAIVTGEDFIYGSGDDLDNSVKLIVSRKSVTINKKFSGVIIAEGKVILHADVVAESINSNVLSSKSGDITLTKYIRGLSASGTENAWDMKKLVSYSNWKKN